MVGSGMERGRSQIHGVESSLILAPNLQLYLSKKPTFQALLGRKRSQKRRSGVPPKDVASNLGVSVSTLYRWIPASNQL